RVSGDKRRLFEPVALLHQSSLELSRHHIRQQWSLFRRAWLGCVHGARKPEWERLAYCAKIRHWSAFLTYNLPIQETSIETPTSTDYEGCVIFGGRAAY